MTEIERKRLLSDLCDIVSHAEETGSTNNDARQLLAEFPGVDTVLRTADCQTGGRGRQGKTFASPKGGLYMTLAMRTGVPLESAVAITSCAAVAVSRALAKWDVPCGIKWVNDIYLNGAKLAGILVESVNDYAAMRSEYVIIGIGVNVKWNIFLEGVHAVSLEEAGFDVDGPELCENIVRELLDIRRNHFDFSVYANEYRERSIVLGREVMFRDKKDGAERYGLAEAIDRCGGLVVRCRDDGECRTLDSGEITLRIQE